MCKQTLCRNKEKLTGIDESSGMLVAMEGLNVVNGIEAKMTCSTSKVYNISSVFVYLEMNETYFASQ